MQALTKGFEKVKQEQAASENDGPVSEMFLKVQMLCDVIFLGCVELLFFFQLFV